MKIKILIIFWLVRTLTFGQTVFQNAYGGIWTEAIYSLEQTSDGGYVMVGSSSSFGPIDEIYLVKTNTVGAVQWSKTFGTGIGENGTDLKQTSDGGYIIAGTTNSYSTDIFLVKTDLNGNLQWSNSYGGTSSAEMGNSVDQTSDGGFIVAGHTDGYGAGQWDIYLIKTSNNGNLLWTRTFGGPEMEDAFDVKATSDGGIIICGYNNSFQTYDGNVYLIKTDANGTKLWSKSYNALGGDAGYSIQQTSDGGYIVSGQTWNYTSGFSDALLLKVDGLGNMQWAKACGGASYDYGYSITQTSDGGFMMTGETTSFGALGADLFSVKTNSIGNLQWSKMYGGAANEDNWSSGVQTTDGGYALGILGGSFGSGNGDFYFLKTDNSGNSGCNQNSIGAVLNTWTCAVISPADTISSGGIKSAITTTVNNPATMTSTLCVATGLFEQTNNFVYNLFPNPMTNSAILKFENLSNESHSLRLYNTNGQLSLSISDITSDKIEIERNNLSNGLYFFRLLRDEKVITTGILIIE